MKKPPFGYSSDLPAGQKSTEKHTSFIADNFSSPSRLDDLFQNLPPDLVGWVELYLRLQLEGVKASRTVRAVRSDLKKFIEFFLDHHRSIDVCRWLPRTTQRFLEHLEEKDQKPRTIHRTLVSVRSFARWMLAVRPDFFLLGDPTKGVKPPVQEPLRPKCLDDRQVKRILDAAYHLICQCYAGDRLTNVAGSEDAWYRKAHRQMRRPFRDYAILMLLLNGGLRRSEVCELTLDQLQGRHLRNVRCKGNLYRDVLLGEETLRALQGYLKEERPRDEKVFQDSSAFFLPSASRRHRNQTGSLSPRTVNAIVDHIAKAANQGLPLEEHILLHPHMFRHTHAYRILKQGRSLPYLQKRLGHQSMNYLALYAQMPEKVEKELLDEAEFK